MEIMEKELRLIAKVVINRSADSWELYSSMPGAENAAIRINREIEKLARKGLTRDEFTSRINKTFDEYSGFGANDSEPQYHLSRIINQLYGEENYA